MLRPTGRSDEKRLLPRSRWIGALCLFVGMSACSLPPPTSSSSVKLPSELAANVEVIRADIQLPETFSIPYRGHHASTRELFPRGFPRSFGSGIGLKSLQERAVEFWVVGDRGPNGDGPEVDGHESKLFPAPDYHPAFGVLRLAGQRAEAVSVVNLWSPDGRPMSGLPIPPLGQRRVEETALNESLQRQPANPLGVDPEAIAYDGVHLWLSDEYGPFVLKVDPASGRILEHLSPGRGLPTVFAKRRANRGMECLTFDRGTHHLWGALQSVVDDGEVALGRETVRLRAAGRFIRWVEIDPADRSTRQYAYPVDAGDYKRGDTGHAKLGDLASISDRQFVVIEEGKGADGRYFNRLFLVGAKTATDIQRWDGTDLERSSVLGRAVNGADWRSVVPLRKRLLLDLNRLGWTYEKAEGLALVDERTLVVVNDNDYGVMSELTDESGQPVSGQPEDCSASGHGPPLFGMHCPDGAVSLRVARMPDIALTQSLWLIRFPRPIADYGH